MAFAPRGLLRTGCLRHPSSVTNLQMDLMRRAARRGALALGAFMLAAALHSGGAAAQSQPGNWSGFYVGGEAGWAFGAFHDDWRFTNANYFNTLGPVLLGSNFSFDPDGAIGGGLGGYNWQRGNWVFGAEVAVDATGYHDKIASPFFPTIDTYSTNVDWIATAAGRVGMASGRWLFFAKGGYAGGDVELHLVDAAAGVNADLDRWANGYVAGAGAEFALTDRVSIGAAYEHIGLFVDGATMNCGGCGVGAGFGTPSVKGDVVIDKLTGRFTVHFN